MRRGEVITISLTAAITILFVYIFTYYTKWSYSYTKFDPVSHYLGLSISIFSIGLFGLLIGYFSAKNIKDIYMAVGLYVYCNLIIFLLFLFLRLDDTVTIFSTVMVLSVSLPYAAQIAKHSILKLPPVAFLVGISLTLISGLYQKRFFVRHGESCHFGFPFVWLQAERGGILVDWSTLPWRYSFQWGFILDILLYSAIVYSAMVFLASIIHLLVVRKF